MSEEARDYTRKRKLEEVENLPVCKANPVPLSHYRSPAQHTAEAVLTMPAPFSLESGKRHEEVRQLLLLHH